MSKELKFRTWHKTKKIMGMVFQIDFEAKGVWVKFHNPDMDMDEADFWDFNEINLEQYTGRKDKNDMEIYEGSKICCDSEYIPCSTKLEGPEPCHDIGSVEWSEYLLAWVVKFEDETTEFLVDLMPGDLKIIGNIYEEKI